ncbi:MAG TPA: hypothetical protein VMP01_09300 [Pirellulaceae bacterium]|nr:hypothetical protein [Pirellulaceae bacterium]
MNAIQGRGWLLVLAGLLPGSVPAQESSPPALLPPSTFAARIAAQRLVPVPPDLTADADWQPAEILPASSEAIARSASPSVSLQPDYEMAMGCVPHRNVGLADFSFRPSAAPLDSFGCGRFESMSGPAVERMDLAAALDAVISGLVFASTATERPEIESIGEMASGGVVTASSPGDWVDKESGPGDLSQWQNPFALEAETSLKTSGYFSDFRNAIKSANSCWESCLSSPAGITETVLGF